MDTQGQSSYGIYSCSLSSYDHGMDPQGQSSDGLYSGGLSSYGHDMDAQGQEELQQRGAWMDAEIGYMQGRMQRWVQRLVRGQV